MGDDISKKVVYPNKIIIPMNSSAIDPMDIKCFDPVGIFGVNVLRAAGLPGKGGLRSLIGQDKPDAYAKVRVGATMHETNVVKNSTEPEWEGEW